MNSFSEYVSEVELRLGLRSGFFDELIREDDWSFVIKLHAFVEAVLTHAICSNLGRPELEPIVSRLDTGNNQCGKLAFAKALAVLGKPQRRYIAQLCALRNELAHNVKSAEFSFNEFMDNLPEKDRYFFCVSLSLDEQFRNEYEDGEVQIISLVNEVPKFGICYAASILISDLLVVSLEGDAATAYRDLGERLVAQANSVLSIASTAS